MKNDEIITSLLDMAMRPHTICGEPWYSCPKSSEGSTDTSYSKDECTCGADEHNAKVLKLINKYNNIGANL